MSASNKPEDLVPAVMEKVDELITKGADNLTDDDWMNLERLTEFILAFGKGLADAIRVGYNAFYWLAHQHNNSKDEE
jgi:hypothetical protein